MIRDELQTSFKQRTELNTHRKQQELEDDLFRRTLDVMQEVDLDSQRVRIESCWAAHARLHDVVLATST